MWMAFSRLTLLIAEWERYFLTLIEINPLFQTVIFLCSVEQESRVSLPTTFSKLLGLLFEAEADIEHLMFLSRGCEII